MNKENLDNYGKRITFLKGLLEAKQMVSFHYMYKPKFINNVYNDKCIELILSEFTLLKENSIQKSIALQMLAPNSVQNSSKVKEIYLKNIASCENSLRDELLQGWWEVM